MFLLVAGHGGIQDNEDADALAREGSSCPFHSSEPTISVSPCVGRLKERHSKNWAVEQGMRQSKLFTSPMPSSS
jgi:hypothetical protein